MEDVTVGLGQLVVSNFLKKDDTLTSGILSSIDSLALKRLSKWLGNGDCSFAL